MTDGSFNSSTRTRRGFFGSTFGSAVLLILLLLALVGFGWAYTNYFKAQRQIAALSDPNIQNELNQAETKALLEKVGKLIVIPSNEDPVVATINDVETLATQQDFYKDANNGDKLIIFYSAQKAIIYDEEANVLVNVGPVSIKDQDGNNQNVIRMEGKLNVEVRNGSQDTSKGVSTRDDLRSEGTFNIIRLAKAANTSYDDTVLVDLTGGAKTELIQKLEELLGVTATTTMPIAEGPTVAEALIIVGNK